jgi:hypothetical protein
MSQARLSELFKPELDAGIRMFTGGRDVVDVSDLSSDEINDIEYCFETNVKKIEFVSPKIAAGLRPQKRAMLRWAQVAKGTFPEQKTYSYPGQQGGLAVDFLNPYLFGWGDVAGTGGNSGYLNIAGAAGTTEMRTWDISFTAGTATYLLGYDATYKYYKSCPNTGHHAYSVLFQDGILEVGTQSSIGELFFKSELLDKYTPISAPPLGRETIEEGRQIFQYNTPGMIPLSFQTGSGVHIFALPLKTVTAHMPLLGMIFYETDYNVAAATIPHV